MSILLSRPVVPVLAGFSPMMQFVHVDDMAAAIDLALKKNKPGIYNVAPDDWVPYQEAVRQSGCRRIPVPSIPPAVPRVLGRLLQWNAYFPPWSTTSSTRWCWMVACSARPLAGSRSTRSRTSSTTTRTTSAVLYSED